jgi:transcriptional regulator with XRE-family HTH domain
MDIVNAGEIRRRRKKLGMTQQQAAKAAGWKSAVQWTDIERSKRPNPSIKTVAAVARALGCKVDQIIRAG